MADKSKIEWTDASWNPIVGCSIVSPGCTNCYAMKQAARIELMTIGENAARAADSRDARLGQIQSHYAGTTKQTNGGAVWTGKISEAPQHILTAPLRWKRPRRIFVNSMSDLFHESVPDAWIDRVFAVMALCPQHTFQVLTKRSERMRRYASDFHVAHDRDVCVRIADAASDWGDLYPGAIRKRWPLRNVWLGVSAEDRRRYAERKDDLRATPAAVHFFSFEPLLGKIDADYLGEWAIIGGESGPGARPMHPDWARAIRDQCAAAGVPFFFKQHGEWIGLPDDRGPISTPDDRVHQFDDGEVCYRVGKRRAGRLLDGVEYNAFPEAML
jgi:protein gp37